MHSALFMVSVPVMKPDENTKNYSETGENKVKWSSFLAEADAKVKTGEYVLRLSENIWLVDVTTKLASLAWLISAASEKKLSYGILPFEHVPEWLPAEFHPTSIQDHSAVT